MVGGTAQVPGLSLWLRFVARVPLQTVLIPPGSGYSVSTSYRYPSRTDVCGSTLSVLDTALATDDYGRCGILLLTLHWGTARFRFVTRVFPGGRIWHKALTDHIFPFLFSVNG